jgi:hypothetical protein
LFMRIVQFLCQLFACGKAAVQIDELHQIDNRVSPVELLWPRSRYRGRCSSISRCSSPVRQSCPHPKRP